LIDPEYENILRNYLGVPIVPKPGDPLINMEVVGTDIDNLSNKLGGSFGCVRNIPVNCESKTKNLIVTL